MHSQQLKAVTRPAVNDINEEANKVANDLADNYVMDAAHVAFAQAVEHHKITRYGILVA